MFLLDELFDLKDNKFLELFENIEYVWEILPKIKKYLENNLTPNMSRLADEIEIKNTLVLYNNEIFKNDFKIEFGDATKGKLKVIYKGKLLEGASVICAGAQFFSKEVYIGKNTIIEPGALIKGPCYIGDFTEVRQGAYIRGNVIIGNKCVVGHTTEMKNSIMLGESKAGHFAYIGDSILGKVNLGAGTKLANLKMLDSPVSIVIKGEKYNTGIKKIGAILGDNVELGCNSVTSPGTIICKNSVVYPATVVRGYIPSKTVIKPQIKLKTIPFRD